MRWIKLSAEHFGPMTRWQADTDRDFVVFLGKNEAGKSTVMELTQGLLFGYGNKKELRARLVARGAGEAVISGEVVLDDGSRVTLQRTVRESGTEGLYTRGETASPMNGPFPPVASLGRELMQGAYALTQDQLKFPEARDWQQVQSRLLSGQVDPRLVPYGDADKALLDAANGIWRGDNRGSTRWKEHTRNLEAASRGEAEALERQAEIAALHGENRGEAASAVDTDARRKQAEAFLKQAEDWNRLAAEEAGLEQRQQEARGAEAFASLPPEPGADWAACQSRKTGLDRELAQLKERMAACDAARAKAEEPDCLRLLENREVLELIPGARVRMDEETHTLRSLEEGRQAAADTLEDTLRSVFPGCPEAADRLPGLEGETLQRRALAVQEAAETLKQAGEAQAAAPGAARKANRPMAVLGWCGAVLALACLVSGVYALLQGLSFAWLVLPGGGLLVLCALLLLLQSRREEKLLRRAEGEKVAAEQALTAAESALEEALGGLRLSKWLRENPENIARGVDTCRDAAQQLEEANAALEKADTLLGRQRKALLQTVSLVLPGREPDKEAVQEVARRLETAITAKYDADKAARALPELLDRKAALEAEGEALSSREAALLAGLEPASGDTPEDKIAAVNALREAARQAARDAAAFEERTPGAAAFIREHREAWPYTEEAMAAARQQAEAAEAEAREAAARQARRLEAARHLEELETPSEAAARKNQVLEAMEDDRRERDATVLTLALVRLAHRRFREENQPALIQRTSELLCAVTGGRYDRLALTEDGQGLLVRLAETGEWLEPEKSRLSRGTLEQLYICLRLALAERLDPGETLPICLDETLINWDTDRIRRGLALIRDIARERQVFLFTCHPWMVELLREQTEDFVTIEL